MNAIVGFGASSMQGAGDAQGGFFKRLSQHAASQGSPAQFVNLGIGGNTTRDMLARFPAATSISPRNTIVMLGCNDLPRARDGNPDRRVPLPEYAANLDRLLGEVKGQRSLFVSSFAVCKERTGISPETFEQYMTQAISLAEKHDYNVWDLYRQFQKIASRYWASDGLHFNPAGHQMIAEKLSELVGAWFRPVALCGVTR